MQNPFEEVEGQTGPAPGLSGRDMTSRTGRDPGTTGRDPEEFLPPPAAAVVAQEPDLDANRWWLCRMTDQDNLPCAIQALAALFAACTIGLGFASYRAAPAPGDNDDDATKRANSYANAAYAMLALTLLSLSALAAHYVYVRYGAR